MSSWRYQQHLEDDLSRFDGGQFRFGSQSRRRPLQPSWELDASRRGDAKENILGTLRMLDSILLNRYNPN